MDDILDDERDAPVIGWAPHLRVGAFAVLLPLALGFGVLAPWVWLGGFGIVIGLIADVIALLVWRGRRGGLFPADIPIGALIGVLGVVVVLGGLSALGSA